MLLLEHKPGDALLLADPQTITINATPVTLLRTGAAQDSGTFRSADTAYSLSVSHAYGKRVRRTFRLDHKLILPDVMDSSLNVPYSLSTYVVQDVPVVGISRAQQGYELIGLSNLMSASSFAIANKFLDGES